MARLYGWLLDDGASLLSLERECLACEAAAKYAEASLAALRDLVPTVESRGIAYGVMGTVNGVGDLAASVLVGALWTAVSPAVAFAYAAVAMGVGTLVLARLR